MASDDPDPRLQALKSALDEREGDGNEPAREVRQNQGSLARGFGNAYRVAIELVVGVVVGLVVGVWLDARFDTSPLWLLIMLFLGFAAGMWNVIRWGMGYDDSLGFRRREDQKPPL